MSPATEDLNRSIEELNKATQNLGQQRGVELPQLSTIPSAVTEQSVPQLEIPQVQIDTEPVNQAVSAAQAFAQSQQQAFEAQQQRVNNQETDIRDLLGVLGGEAAERNRLLESTGTIDLEDQLRGLTSRIGTFSENILSRDDAVQFGLEDLRQGLGAQGVTGNVFSAKAREANLQRSLARRGEAAQLRSLTASAQLMQGNIEGARAEIDAALEAKYAPLRQALDAEKFFIQQQYSRLSTAEKRQADAQQFLLDQEIGQIEQAQQLVQAMLPYATPEEVQRIGAIDNPQEQTQAATQIIARGQAADRAQERAQRGASIAASKALRDQRDIEIQIKKMELDALRNPPSQVTDAATLEVIDGLTDGQREDILNARETVGEIDRMIELVNSVSDINLLTKGTEEGREFQRLSRNVVDKLARERTGAVVGADEEAAFKDIVGVGAFNLIAKSDEELLNGLNNMKRKHDESLSLNDPQGAVRNFLDDQPRFQSDDEVDVAQVEIGTVVTINGVSYRKVGDDQFIEI